MHLKKRRLWLWRDTIAKADLRQESGIGPTSTDNPVRNIVLEPTSERVSVTLPAEQRIDWPVSRFPKYTELVLELSMVGPIRRIRHVLTSVHHDPDRQLDE